MLTDRDLAALVAGFRDQGLIDTYLGPLRPGKEAAIHCCRRPDGGFAVLKHYTRIDHRGFRADACYGLGTGHAPTRDRRAIRDRSGYGLLAKLAIWTANERRNGERLRGLGLRVPRPLGQLGPGLLVQMIGGPDRPAPQLREADLEPNDLATACAELQGMVLAMLAAGLVHGDLSPYNVLMHRGRPWIIDVPQMVEAAVNPAAADLFHRDCASLFGHFRRRGLAIDPATWSAAAWAAWEAGTPLTAEVR
ncbi:MAG: hypothetical protein RLZZ127_2389 [Planctomycetota bacterium]|jgi:RIO kinase 1